MNIQRFDPATARPGHGGTILAGDFLPEGLPAPFRAAWGCLQPGGEMEPHDHHEHEIYVVILGRAEMVIDDETEPVGPGDVIAIPPDATHTIRCTGDEPLLWAAQWWPCEQD